MIYPKLARKFFLKLIGSKSPIVSFFMRIEIVESTYHNLQSDKDQSILVKKSEQI